MKRINLILVFASIFVIFGCSGDGTSENIETTDSKKEPSSYTLQKNQDLRNYLDFTDTTDFISARKGFIATVDDKLIKTRDGAFSYDIALFDFLEGEAPDYANPSLWRQSKLNAIHGLFEVSEGIYQVRGFDLANMSLIRGESGWVIIDPLTAPATARAAMDLVDRELGEFPIKAVIFTHSHIDHFGGVTGIVSEEEVANGQVEIYAPQEFFEHSISENVMAGNTMGRRAMYMYGNLLEKNERGTYGSGLGTTTAAGVPGIYEPTHTISDLKGETHVIDGLEVEFIYTPESEAPAEMMFYFPDLKAFCQSENVNHTLHNLYTLRGAQVRNGQKWSKYIDRSIAKWGSDVEVSFGSHHWPTWGNENIVPYLEKQRDLYRYLHDQTLRLANQGYTPRELADMIQLPDALGKEFYNRGYYGSVSHNIKAQYQLYFGWFDGNPANLNPLPPAESGAKYVEAFGADKILAAAQSSFENGEYRWTAELLNHLVFARPENQDARNLLADTYEQLGFQSESGPWRNFYLSGAQDLREGKKVLETSVETNSPDMVKGMSTELFFDYLGMQFKGTENADLKYNFNLTFPDIDEKVGLIVSNGAVLSRIGEHLNDDITATITMNRSDLDRLSLGQASLEDLINDGAVTIKGDQDAYFNFLSKIDVFDFWFDIVEP